MDIALVEAVPEAVQRQVREGKLAAQLAMKYLAPVARLKLDDCERMAAAFAAQHCTTREAGQLYTAWREGSCVVRKRILETPELFLKAQQQPQTPAATEAAALARDLEMTAAIVQRANRRMGVALTEMDGKQLEQALLDLDRMSLRMKDALSTLAPKEQEERYAEPTTTHGDCGVERQESEQTRDRAGVEYIAPNRTRRSPIQLHGRTEDSSGGEGRTNALSTLAPIPPTDSRIFEHVQGGVHEELVAEGATLSYAALTAFCRRQGIGQKPIVPSGRYDFDPGAEKQHGTSPHEVEVGGRKYKAMRFQLLR